MKVPVPGPGKLLPFLIVLLASSALGDKEVSRDFRLPTSIQPSKYTLKLFVVLDPLQGFDVFTANGEVGINVTCLEATNELILHVGENLTIFTDTIRVHASDGSDVRPNALEREVENDFLILHFREPLESGQTYNISMKFLSPIPDYRLNGMYQDYYIDPETSEKTYLATTLFAPYHARKLFPSFDEPSFRAAYEISIGHHTKYHAMSNEQLVSSGPVEGIPDYQWDHFQTTPSISSYITAMIISDFTYEEAPPTYFHNKTIRIYASPHLIAKGAGEYAANITDAVMAFLEDRFLIKYPLDKLFSIALPHFFFSAMENIGMITYKEPVLLYLKNETTEEERFQINSVMSHELSHQWFGNIVACKWWAYVWLKEGFSTFYSYYGMNHTSPEMEPWELFNTRVLSVAMNFDSSNETHPLENFPPTSAAVADIYTRIPYQKGASILRMTSNFITENVFEEAIKLYINRHQYKSAEQNDLFNALQEALDLNPNIGPHIPAPITDIMNSWCQQSRFPVVSVSRNGTSSFLELTQEEFTEDGPSSSHAHATTTWWIPITVQPRTRSDLPGTVPDAWIPQNITSITVEVTDAGPIIVNPDSIGSLENMQCYYRVKYDDELQSEILELLENDHPKIPSAGRSKLIEDSIQLSLSGYLPLENAMEFTKYIHKDVSTGVWMTIQETMNIILKLLAQIGDDETAQLLREYLLAKATPVWKTLQENPPSALSGSKGLLYEMLFKWSCNLGSCFGLTQEEIFQFIEHPERISVGKEKQFALYCSAIENDDTGVVFGYLLGKSVNPNTLFGEKERILKALACTKDERNLNWMARTIFDPTGDIFSLAERLEMLKVLSKKQSAAKILLNEINMNINGLFEKFEGTTVDDAIFEIMQNLGENLVSEKVVNVLEGLQNIDHSRERKLLGRLRTSLKRQSFLKESKLLDWLRQNM